MNEQQSKTTRDHNEIKRWAEARGGKPSVVKGTHNTKEGGGILRIDFGDAEESLEEIPWDEFFEIFDERGLQFLYQDELADGRESRFFKFIRS